MNDNVNKTPVSSEETENLQTPNNEAAQQVSGVAGLSEPTEGKITTQDSGTVDNADDSKKKPNKSNKKKILIAAIAGVVLITLAVSIGIGIYASKPHTADEWLDLGNKYLLEMDYEQAIVAFLKVIEIEPKNIPARLGLAEAYIAIGKYDEAEIRLLEVLDIDPVNKDAYIALQNLYDLIGDFDKLGKLMEQMRKAGLDEYILFGVITGKIIDGVALLSGTETVLSDAMIDIKLNGKEIRNLRTDNNGMYSCYLRENTFDFSIEKSNYIPYRQKIYIRTNETIYMPTIELIPDSGEQGTISGQVIDSLTGEGIFGASIFVFNQEEAKVTEITTDENGNYELTQTAGYYSIIANSLGYTETQKNFAVFGSQYLANRNLTMTPLLKDGEIRIVLTWGENPADLDSHLIGPQSAGNPFHIAYFFKEFSENGIVMANLDLDDTDSYGPETTTIYRAVEGTYSFIVHDYTNRDVADATALAGSGANVKVYIGNESTREFNVPPNIAGDTWYVFDIVNGELRLPAANTFDLPENDDANYDTGQIIIEGSELTEASRLIDADIENIGIKKGMTLLDFVAKYGLPRNYDSQTTLEADMSRGGLIQDYNDDEYRPYASWNDRIVASVDFSPSNWEANYAYLSSDAKLPFNLKNGLSISETISLMGLDTKAIMLLQSKSVSEAVEYCRNNNIAATQRENTDSKSITVKYGNGSVSINEYYNEWNDEPYVNKSISIYNTNYTFSVSLQDDKAGSFSVSFKGR